jgi:hypothetical protein
VLGCGSGRSVGCGGCYVAEVGRTGPACYHRHAVAPITVAAPVERDHNGQIGKRYLTRLTLACKTT